MEKVGKIRRYTYRYRPLLVDMLLAALSLSLAFEVRFNGGLVREYLSSAWLSWTYDPLFYDHT